MYRSRTSPKERIPSPAYSRKDDLEARVAAQRDMEVQVAAVPVRVRSFLEDFQGMDIRRAKAILQGIIKAAHIFSDGRIELEFRG